MEKQKIKKIGVYVIPILLIVMFLWWFLNRHKEYTDDAQLDAYVVIIAPQITGYVSQIHFKDNQDVKAGQVLVEIEPTDYINAAAIAKANLALAQTNWLKLNQTLIRLKIQIPSQKNSASAQVYAAKANWIKAKQSLDRAQKLTPLTLSPNEKDTFIASEEAMHGSFKDALARLESASTTVQQIAEAKADLEIAANQVQSAQANLKLALTNLERTKIRAPFDGHITQRAIDIGSFLQIGQQLFSLVSHKPWIDANFKETQLTYMRPGQKAHIEIDAFPNMVFEGHVDSIQRGTGAYFSLFPPENATGNYVKIIQRVPVKIAFNHPVDPKMALGPGMSAVITVDTAS